MNDVIRERERIIALLESTEFTSLDHMPHEAALLIRVTADQPAAVPCQKCGEKDPREQSRCEDENGINCGAAEQREALACAASTFDFPPEEAPDQQPAHQPPDAVGECGHCKGTVYADHPHEVCDALLVRRTADQQSEPK